MGGVVTVAEASGGDAKLMGKCQNLRKPLNRLCPRFAPNKPEDIWCTGRLLEFVVGRCRTCMSVKKASETPCPPSLPPSLSKTLVALLVIFSDLLGCGFRVVPFILAGMG